MNLEQNLHLKGLAWYEMTFDHIKVNLSKPYVKYINNNGLH